MKVLIAQTNTTPKDFHNNVNQIKFAVDKGKNNNVDLIITPELSIPGYLVKDLIYDKNFIETNLKYLQNIVCYSQHSTSTIIVGYIDQNHSGQGKPFRNMAAIIRNGNIVATYCKQLLPFYDVFDEGRYFEPGKELTVIDINNEKWGIAICEDVFNDKGSDNYNYNTNPLSAYRKIGINKIISINSSPFVMGKPKTRLDILRKSFKNGTLIYVNQIGGQDELVFDGHSMVIHDNALIHLSSTQTIDIVDLNNKNESYFKENRIKTLFEMLTLGLHDYIKKSGFTQVVIGSSGGIDSAIVIALACKAIGPENVHAIIMPSIYNKESSKTDAQKLHENLKCNQYILPIEHIDLLKKYNDTFKIAKDNYGYNIVADENMQARIRGAAVMHFSNAFGALPLATGNKSELSVGYCTLYGDMSGGFAPIGDVYKMDIYTLANYFNETFVEQIPQEIINKAPSAELSPDQTDEESLLPYPILDIILEKYIEQYIGNFDIFANKILIDIDIDPNIKKWIESPTAKKDYDRIINMVDKNEFKRRQAAPSIKVNKVAFGTGRRLPIVKK